MKIPLGLDDRLGLVRPAVDAHTLGTSSIEQLLSDCGIAVIPADADVNEAIGKADDPTNVRIVRDWIKGNRLTSVGFSYRLDPDDGLRLAESDPAARRRRGRLPPHREAPEATLHAISEFADRILHIHEGSRGRAA